MYEMANGPVYKFCESLLNDLETSPNDPVVLQLAETGVIRHTLMLIVDTQKRVYSRSRRSGQFTKYLDGGGQYDKSAVHAHHSCRESVRETRWGLRLLTRQC